MKEFNCEPYEPSEDFFEYLKELESAESSFCPHLRMLPEEIKIVYESGPSRRYKEGGLFCIEKAEEVIASHCGIESMIRKEEGNLFVI